MKTAISHSIWKDYELFFVLYFAWIYIVNPIAGISRRLIGETHSMDVLLLDAILLIIFLNVLKEIINRVKVWQLFPVVLLFFALLISGANSCDIDTHTTVWVKYWSQCVPIFILAGCVRDFERVYHYLVLLMRIFPYVGFLSFYYFQIGSLGDEELYSASMTYHYLLPAVVLSYDIIKKFSIWSLVPFFISLFMIFGFGSRGPLVSLLLSVLIFILLNDGSFKSKIKVIIPVVVIGVFIIGRSGMLLDSAYGIYSNNNMSTRAITTMSNETFLEDDARSRITRIGMDRVMMNPVWGTGLVNDRIYIQKELNSIEAAHGWYPHNFFVEILMQFGVILGIVVFCLFFRTLYRSYKSSSTPESRSVLLIFIGAYFFPLMFSGSYLEWNGFYALMGLCGAILTNQSSKAISV